VNPQIARRLKKLLAITVRGGFEFELRHATAKSVRYGIFHCWREASGVVTAYQGFLLDSRKRKRAEQEIRRRNPGTPGSEPFRRRSPSRLTCRIPSTGLCVRSSSYSVCYASSLYLFDGRRRCGPPESLRLAIARNRAKFSSDRVPQELLHSHSGCPCDVSLGAGPASAGGFRKRSARNRSFTAYLVILWSKDRVMVRWSLARGTPREFTPSDVNLLIAVGSQTAMRLSGRCCTNKTRQAYDDLRKTQEQLLHSEKMAAVGQLISGMAHETKQSAYGDSRL